MNQAVLLTSVRCAVPLQIMPLYLGHPILFGQSVPRASGDDGGSDTRMPFCTVVQIMKSIILTMTLKFFPLCCSTALDCELKMSRYFSFSVITCMR